MATETQPKRAENGSQPFLSDVKAIRERARRHIEEGPVTPAYEADKETACSSS